MRLARPRGFEPLTPRSVVWCSIQLSYGRLAAAGAASGSGRQRNLLASNHDGKQRVAAATSRRIPRRSAPLRGGAGAQERCGGRSGTTLDAAAGGVPGRST